MSGALSPDGSAVVVGSIKVESRGSKSGAGDAKLLRERLREAIDGRALPDQSCLKGSA